MGKNNITSDKQSSGIGFVKGMIFTLIAFFLIGGIATALTFVSDNIMLIPQVNTTTLNATNIYAQNINATEINASSINVDGKTIVDNTYIVTVCNSTYCDYTTDGTADDVQIQEAIDFAKTSSNGRGSTVKILSGDYYCSKQINYTQNTTNDLVNILGEGVDSTRLIFSNTSGILLYPRSTDAGTMIEFGQMSIEDRGRFPGYSLNTAGLIIPSSSRLKVHDLKIYYFYTGINNTCGVLTEFENVYISTTNLSFNSICSQVSNRQLILNKVDAENGIRIENLSMLDMYSTQVGTGGLLLDTLWNFNIFGGWGEDGVVNINITDCDYGGSIYSGNWEGSIFIRSSNYINIYGLYTGLDNITIDSNSKQNVIFMGQNYSSKIKDSGSNTIVYSGNRIENENLVIEASRINLTDGLKTNNVSIPWNKKIELGGGSTKTEITTISGSPYKYTRMINYGSAGGWYGLFQIQQGYNSDTVVTTTASFVNGMMSVGGSTLPTFNLHVFGTGNVTGTLWGNEMNTKAYKTNGTEGFTGTCADGTSLTVKGGIITGCS